MDIKMFTRILLAVILLIALTLCCFVLLYQVQVPVSFSAQVDEVQFFKTGNLTSIEIGIPTQGYETEPEPLRPIGVLHKLTTPPPIKPKQRPSSSCGTAQHTFTASGQAVHLNSLNYPNSYPLRQDCTYELSSPPGTKMTFKCDTFNVPCSNDWFYYSLDGGSSYSGYCGEGIVPSMTTQGNALSVVFHSGRRRPFSRNNRYRYQCTIAVTGTQSNATTPRPAPCSCGTRNFNGTTGNRIIGGMPTKNGELPWRAAVYIYDNATAFGEICGATILSQNWLSTAAHCTDYAFQRGYKIDVYVGAQANPVTTGTGTPITVDRYVQHPAYNRQTFDNDISLLHLPNPLTFKSNISPICLPFPLVNFNFSGTTALASGWGTTKPVASGIDNADPVSETLLEVSLPVLTNAECRKYTNTSITDNMICTYTPGKDTCQGDSGGSLDYMNLANQRYYSIGIVSSGIGCAQPDNPGVYTKVTNYLGWIQRTTKEAFCQA